MPRPINGLFPGELKPDAVVAGCINIYENAWPNPQETIKLVEQTCADPYSGINWERAGTIGSGPRQDIRTNFHLRITEGAEVIGDPVMQNIHNQFYVMLLASTLPYCEKYNIQENLWHEPYTMLRYGEGQEYKGHYDGPTDMGRAISALVYLNDDYEGGELEFPNYNIKIKPQAGMLIVFPSAWPYLHIAAPVKNGTKYALVAWIHDRPI